ncbi:PepSY domain-containing protein [Paenibacillus sonchi]|uniref:PepSY domain-containing protein n=1 Tax=Paenibacillus sonchi TaxID=373687 RepID=A0A974SFJ8_9BACL|nr:PepSY domain-containing protein [Paenibacillus sonchi]QQZ63356.1 PepSY domain-containing protein [Paenibacillus sonchi]
MKKKLWSSIAAAAILLGGAYSISEVQAASAGNSASAGTSKTLIGISKAEQAALKAAPGRVESIDLEKKPSGAYYEVDIQQQNKEIDVRVDAYTGSIISVREEADDDDDGDIQPADAAESKAVISAAQAAEAASAAAKGKVVEIDLDQNKGSLVYEVEVRNGKVTTEVGVDAYTAKVLYTDEDWE